MQLSKKHKLCAITLFIKMPTNEIEMIKNTNVANKIDYIKNTYDDNLRHKHNQDVCIIGWKFSLQYDLNIGMVVSLLQTGLKLRRGDWFDYEYIYYDQQSNAILDENESIWQPTNVDLFATNWEVVERAKYEHH